MADKKTRNPRFVTPKGELIYPYLSRPDTQFNSDGEFKAEQKLPEDAELFDSKGNSQGKITDFLNTKIDEAVEHFGEIHNGKKKKGKTIEVTESPDPPFFVDEGQLYVKFKLKHHVKPENGEAFTQSPVLFDAKGNKVNLSAKKNPWNGTIAKINFECVPYYNPKDAVAGVTLRLKAAQLIDPVFGGDASADQFGFGEEEGYEAGDEPEGDDEGFDEEEGYDGSDDDEGEEEDDDEQGDF